MDSDIAIPVLAILLLVTIGVIVYDNFSMHKELALTGNAIKEIASVQVVNSSNNHESQKQINSENISNESLAPINNTAIQKIDTNIQQNNSEDIYSKKYETFRLTGTDYAPTTQAILVGGSNYEEIKSMLEPGLTIWIYPDKMDSQGFSELCGFVNSAGIKMIIGITKDSIEALTDVRRCSGVSAMIKVGPSNQSNG